MRTLSVILACLGLCACATTPSDDEQDFQYIPSAAMSARGSMLFDAEDVRESPMTDAFNNALRSPTYLDDGDKPNIQRLASQRFFSLGSSSFP